MGNYGLHQEFELEAAVYMREVPALDFLYKEIQFGLRVAVGTRTLDALLEDKGAVDRSVFEHVHDAAAGIGIDVRSIGVRSST